MSVRDGVWRILEARDGAWAVLAVRASDAKNSGGAWRRVEGPMKTKFYQKGRSERLLSDGVIYGLIKEAEAVAAARQWSLMY